MRYTKLIFLSLAITCLISFTASAQDGKSEKETAGCSTVKSCCEKTSAVSEVKAEPWNSVCPVMGNKVDTEVATVEYDGKNYGFCCGGCDAKFSKDPERFSKNLNKDGSKFSKSRS
jgi:YHS domain-containing protein